MTAQTLHAAGLFIGERLMPPHWSNPEGHFEDLDFYELSCAIMADEEFPTSGLVSDVQVEATAYRRQQAEELVARRRALGVPWGWKDPRSVLLLDFWAELLPEAHFLFTFRAPWEVMDSLYRRGDQACQDDPHLPLRVWLHYNRIIRDFALMHPSRVSLFEVGQVSDDPGRCVRVVAARMGIELRAEVATVRHDLMLRVQSDEQVALVNALSPSSTRLYAQLCEMAGSDPAVRVRSSSARELTCALERSLLQWARSRAQPEGTESA